jgi:hypothetical protein
VVPPPLDELILLDEGGRQKRNKIPAGVRLVAQASPVLRSVRASIRVDGQGYGDNGLVFRV